MKCLKLAKTETKGSIEKRLEEALAQHAEDASEADTDAQLNTKRALRESVEKIAALEMTQKEILTKLQALLDKK